MNRGLCYKQYRKMSKTERKYEAANEVADRLGMKLGKNLTHKSLKAGMKVVACYDCFNFGIDAVEILGVTGNDHEYGQGGVEFQSVKDMLNHYGVTRLLTVEDEVDAKSVKKNGWGFHTYLYARDLEPTNDPNAFDEGPWYYLYRGHWSRGSGAEALSFIELISNEEHEARLIEHYRQDRIHDLEAQRSRIRTQIEGMQSQLEVIERELEEAEG